MEEASAIVVAEEGKAAAFADDGGEELRHTGELLAIIGGSLFQHSMKCEHVERVQVVIRRLLEVAAVVLHALLHVLANDFAAQ